MSGLTREIRDLDGDRHWIVSGPGGAITFWPAEPDSGVIGVHSAAPTYDCQPGREDCQFIGGICYGDAAYLAARDLHRAWLAADRDDGVIWTALAEWYADRIEGNRHRPVDVRAAIDGRGPGLLDAAECRRALADVADGQSVHDAIRARYAARRDALRALPVADQDTVEVLLAVHAGHLPLDERHERHRELCAATEAGDEAAADAALDALTGVRA